MGAENIGEIQKLLGIAGKAGEFGKNEAGDVPALNIGNHPLGFGLLHDGFAAHASEIIKFADFPAFGFRIEAGSVFVMLRAFTARLIFGRNPNPDADRFANIVGFWNGGCLHGTIIQFALLHASYLTRRQGKCLSKRQTLCMKWKVPKKQIYKEAQLASLAKKFRVKAGKTKAEAARELDISRSTIQHAEE